MCLLKLDNSMKEENAKMMKSTEKQYIENENTTGFAKDYLYSDYCYVALLPNEEIDINDYIASLNTEKLTNLLSNKNWKYYNVHAQLPKPGYCRS